MHHTYVRLVAGAVTVAIAALAGTSPALAARRPAHTHIRHTRHHAVTSTSTSGSSSSQGNGETALTGSTLSSADAAAIAANPGATANNATTETDSSLSGAAYEVHITKADGSRAVVIEDASFNVLATQAAGDPGGCDGDHGSPPAS